MMPAAVGSDILRRWDGERIWPWGAGLSARPGPCDRAGLCAGTGGSVDTRSSPRLPTLARGRRMIADYCIDAAFLAASIASPSAAVAARSSESLYPHHRCQLALADRGVPARRRQDEPANLVSSAARGSRDLPTRFEMRKSRWRPDRDLRVLITGRKGELTMVEASRRPERHDRGLMDRSPRVGAVRRLGDPRGIVWRPPFLLRDLRAGDAKCL